MGFKSSGHSRVITYLYLDDWLIPAEPAEGWFMNPLASAFPGGLVLTPRYLRWEKGEATYHPAWQPHPGACAGRAQGGPGGVSHGAGGTSRGQRRDCEHR